MFYSLAAVAKRKVKEKLTGKKQEDSTGGMGGLFPSEGQKKPTQKEGGLFGGLLHAEPGAQQPAGPAAYSGGNDGGEFDCHYLKKKLMQTFITVINSHQFLEM